MEVLFYNGQHVFFFLQFFFVLFLSVIAIYDLDLRRLIMDMVFPHILLQVSDKKLLHELVRKIRLLSGVFIESEIFVKDATHFICDELTCSELFLGACSKGLWILNSKFVDDSFGNGYWMKEENYEHRIDQQRQNSELVLAANRWRWKTSLFQEQPFTDWNVAVDCNSQTSGFCQRILQLGGANVNIFYSLSQLKQLQHIAYVFLDSTNTVIADELSVNGFLTLNHQFIIDTIIKDYILNPFDYRVGSNTLAPSGKSAESVDFVSERKKSGMKFNRKKSVMMKIVSRDRHSNIEEIGTLAAQSKCKHRGKRPLKTTLLERKNADRKIESHFTEGQKRLKINVEVNDNFKSSHIKSDIRLLDCLSPAMEIHSYSTSETSLILNESKNTISHSSEINPKFSLNLFVADCKKRDSKVCGSLLSSNCNSEQKYLKSSLIINSGNSEHVHSSFIKINALNEEGLISRQKKQTQNKQTSEMDQEIKQTSFSVESLESVNSSANLSNRTQKIDSVECIRNSEIQKTDLPQKISHLDSNRESHVLKCLQPSICVHGLQNPVKKSLLHRKLSQKNLFDCFFKQKINIKESCFGITNNDIIHPSVVNIPVEDIEPCLLVSVDNNTSKKKLPSMNSSLSEVEPATKVVNLENQNISPVLNIESSLLSFTCDSSQKKLKKKSVVRHSNGVQSHQTVSDISRFKQSKNNKNITTVFNTDISSMFQRKSERLRKKKTLDSSKKKIPNEDNQVCFHLSSWLFLYPVPFLSCSENFEKNSSLCGELMTSARELDFLDGALSFGVPFPDYVPGTKELKELLCLLLSSDAKISCQANSYMQSWLRLHPPVVSKMIKKYLEAFNFHSHTVDFFEMIQENIKQQNYLGILWIFDYCVSLFEINWKNTLKDLKKSMVAMWLWQNPFEASYGKTTKNLLKTLKNMLLIPELMLNLKLHFCTSVSSLIALAAECIRLSDVHWNLSDPTFNKDPVITLACDLSDIILICLSEINFDTMIAVIHSVEPDWLKALVVASLISNTHRHIMVEKFNIKSFTWCNIVSHFFHLSPALQCTVQTNDKPHENTDLKLASRVNKKNYKGESQVHIACRRNNHKKLQELLLTPGVNINMADNAGWTPLHEACWHGSLECVHLLLHTKTSNKNMTLDQIVINAATPEGITPLMEAAEKNHVDICKLLLKYGGRALLFTKNEQGLTAFDFAKNEEMKAVLNGFSDEPDIHETTAYISYKECSEYLKLLSLLLTSCYSCMLTLSPQVNLSDGCIVLKNILTDFEELKNYFEKLTRYDDYRMLQIDFKCLELILHEIVSAF